MVGQLTQITSSAVPDCRRHGHFTEIWQFYKLDVRGKLVAAKVAVSYAVRHQLMTPQQQRGCWQHQGSQQPQERQL